MVVYLFRCDFYLVVVWVLGLEVFFFVLYEGGGKIIGSEVFWVVIGYYFWYDDLLSDLYMLGNG